MTPEDQIDQASKVRLLRVLPGGAQAIPEEWYAAAIVGGSLLVLVMMRRGMGNEAAHVHIGGSAAIAFLLYYLIVTAIVRIIAGNLAGKDTPLARAVAFFA